jgi:hypothetical protein
MPGLLQNVIFNSMLSIVFGIKIIVAALGGLVFKVYWREAAFPNQTVCKLTETNSSHVPACEESSVLQVLSWPCSAFLFVMGQPLIAVAALFLGIFPLMSGFTASNNNTDGGQSGPFIES